MPMTDAQRRAHAAYRKKVKQLTVRFYPNSEEDDALYEWLKSRPEGASPFWSSDKLTGNQINGYDATIKRVHKLNHGFE